MSIAAIAYIINWIFGFFHRMWHYATEEPYEITLVSLGITIVSYVALIAGGFFSEIHWQQVYTIVIGILALLGIFVIAIEGGDKITSGTLVFALTLSVFGAWVVYSTGFFACPA